LAAASLALSSAAFAAGAKTYEATGPVLEVNDSMIAIQKGKDRWEINRDANTKVTGDVPMIPVESVVCAASQWVPS